MAVVHKISTSLRRQAAWAWVILAAAWSLFGVAWLLPPDLFTPLWGLLLKYCAFALAAGVTWPCVILIRGYGGESKVLRALEELPDQYHIFNDILLEVGGRKAQIDHVVVSPQGVWCVETKAHLGRVYGKENDKHWTQVKRSSRGRAYKSSFYNPVRQNQTHCLRLREHLKHLTGQDIPVSSVIVFTSAELQVTTTTPVVSSEEVSLVIQARPSGVALQEDELLKICEALGGPASPLV